MDGRPLVVACIVLLAGCSTFLGPRTGTPPSPTPAWSGDPDNHFRERTLTVAVENDANASRNFVPAVRRALAYWEANAGQYAGFPVAYRLVPDAENPDVRVRFVENIETCGTESHAAGCAPILTNESLVHRPVTVRVADGFTDESTVAVLKHELGHTLGLHHGDAPESVMRAKSNLTTLPRPDATTKALPWADPELAVYLNLSAVPQDERAATRRQVDAALGYFADGAAGTVPENVSFTYTDDRAAADVVVTFRDELDCGPNSGSCGALVGTDPDGDGELETYTRLRVTIGGLDTDAVAWHVGRWLGKGFGFEGEAEYPEPLKRSASYHERRSEWWT